MCRGVAVMPEGLPIPGDTVRQTWGQGVRSGMYPISETELYWFTVFNAPKVQSSTSSSCCVVLVPRHTSDARKAQSFTLREASSALLIK